MHPVFGMCFCISIFTISKRTRFAYSDHTIAFQRLEKLLPEI